MQAQRSTVATHAACCAQRVTLALPLHGVRGGPQQPQAQPLPGVPHFVLPQKHTTRHVAAGAADSTPSTSTCEGSASTNSLSGSTDGSSVAAAWQLLREFTQKEFRGAAQSYVATSQQRQRLNESIMVIYGSTWPEAGWWPGPEADVLLGVVASDIRIAVRAYRDWVEALGLPYAQPTSMVEDTASLAGIKGSVYLKYNARTRQAYVSTYTGNDRGVLLQLGQQQLGHFPLGLFDEAMSKPPPQL